MLSPDRFRALFDTFTSTALRLESRRFADIPDERLELAAFLAGELPETYRWTPDRWTEMISRQNAAGRLFRRVRVLDDPLTDYSRYLIYCGQASAAVGEDLRYLRRERADALDLPDHDFWVFDSALLVELRFTDAGRPLGHDLITDPAVVARHEEWINRGFAAATRSVDYLAEDPSRAWPPVRSGVAKGT